MSRTAERASRRAWTARTAPKAVLCLCVALVGLSLPAGARATQGDEIVAAAASQAGVQYCWDGGTINGPTRGTVDPYNGDLCAAGTVGFDCTGLTLYAVHQVTGDVLSHDGRQGTEGGQRITSEADLLPGDLVFYGGTYENFEHAGIYAGNGKIWDALTEGHPVQLDPINGVGLPFVGGARYWAGSGAPANGAFVSHGGNVYRMAGGAPIYVSSWAAFGGPQATQALTDAQWNALPPYPVDGTFINAQGRGDVYRIAGGAPTYVSSWAPYGGPQPSTGVDPWSIDNTDNPEAHLRSYPADGTFVSGQGRGDVYRVAGGAPIYVSSWTPYGGPQPSVGVDPWSIDHTSDPHAHLRSRPVDGTLVSAQGRGDVYRVAGGAPLYVSTWSAIGGSQPSVGIDPWALDNIANPAAHLASVPLNGTFLRTSTGSVYRIAGGAPFWVSNWSVFGGAQPSIQVDQWDVDNAANPSAHLRATPSDGTVVQGIPSNGYWSFAGGLRSVAAPSSGATRVDDVGLEAFAEAPRASGGGGGSAAGGSAGGGGGGVSPVAKPDCVVPRLSRMTIARAKRALSRAHCSLGHVSRPRRRERGRALRVRRQSARPGTRHTNGFPVRILLVFTGGRK